MEIEKIGKWELKSQNVLDKCELLFPVLLSALVKDIIAYKMYI